MDIARCWLADIAYGFAIRPVGEISPWPEGPQIVSPVMPERLRD
jgi:hypothetical protein